MTKRALAWVFLGGAAALVVGCGGESPQPPGTSETVVLDSGARVAVFVPDGRYLRDAEVAETEDDRIYELADSSGGSGEEKLMVLFSPAEPCDQVAGMRAESAAEFAEGGDAVARDELDEAAGIGPVLYGWEQDPAVAMQWFETTLEIGGGLCHGMFVQSVVPVAVASGTEAQIRDIARHTRLVS